MVLPSKKTKFNKSTITWLSYCIRIIYLPRRLLALPGENDIKNI